MPKGICPFSGLSKKDVSICVAIKTLKKPINKESGKEMINKMNVGFMFEHRNVPSLS